MASAGLRALAAVSLVACTIGILYAPFHAAAYLATEDGEPPLVPWAPAFRELAGGALTFGSPDDVYVAYGKLAWIGLAGMLAGAVVLHARQRDAANRTERVGFLVLAAALGLLVLGTLVEYYTPYLDTAFLFLVLPGMLLMFGGYVTFGLGTRRAGVAPKPVVWIFTLAPLVVVAMVALFGHIPLALAPLEAAWIVAILRTNGRP